MKPRRSSKFLPTSGLFAAISFAMSMAAGATPFTWDPNGAGADTGGAGTWDTTSFFWDNGGVTTWPGSGLDNDAVFGGTVGTGLVSIDAGGVTANDLTFSTTGYTIQTGPLTLNGSAPTITTDPGVTATINSNILGSNGLTKSGAGTLTLGGSNTYSGNTIISGGTLSVNAPSNLPSASEVTLSNGATLQVATGNSVYNNALNVASGDFGVVKIGSGTNQRLNGSFAGVAGNLILDVTNGAGGGFILEGLAGQAASGSVVTIQNTGGGATYLMVNSTFARSIFANSKLRFDNSSTGSINLHNLTAVGGTIEVGALDGGNANTNLSNNAFTLQINGATDGSYSGNINTTVTALTKLGSGTQALLGVNSYTGATNISGGTLTVSNLSSTAVTIANGSVLKLQTASNQIFNSALIVASGDSGVVKIGTGINQRLNGSFSGVAGNLILDSTNASSGPGGFSLNGAAGAAALGSTITLKNTGTGLNYLFLESTASRTNFANSKVQFSSTGVGSQIQIYNLGDVGGTVQVGALDGGNANSTFNGSTFALQINGATNGNFAGNINTFVTALTKEGSATQTLSGVNTYTGATSVNGGTLIINGSISNSVLTTVNTGGTIGGSGTIGALTVSSGGTLSPGNGIDSLEITDDLTLSHGSFSVFEINAALDTADLAIASAILAFDGTLTVSNLAGTLANGDVFDLFNWGSTSGSFDAVNLPSLGSGLSWNTSNLYTNGTIAVVPEPAAALLGGLGLLTLLRRRRA